MKKIVKFEFSIYGPHRVRANFPQSAPAVWNSLPGTVLGSLSLAVCKSINASISAGSQ